MSGDEGPSGVESDPEPESGTTGSGGVDTDADSGQEADGGDDDGDVTRCLLLHPPGEDRRLLARSLSADDRETIVADGADDLPESFDLAIVAPSVLEAVAGTLAARRAAATPAFLPVLLVVPERASRGGDPLGELPGELADVVDDAVLAPIRELAIHRRVDGLLRARRLSLRLAESRERYRRLVELLPAAVLLLKGQRIVYYNEAAESLLAGGAGSPNGVADGRGIAGVDADPSREGAGGGGRARNGDGHARSEGDAPPGGNDEFAAALGERSGRGAGLVHDRLVDFAVDADREVLSRTLEAGDGTFREGGLRTLDGRTVDAEVAATRVGVGGETYTQVVVRDQTERNEHEERLRLYRRAMEEASVGITITDTTRPDNPIVYANPEFGRLTGHDREEVVGRNARFMQTDRTDPETVATLRRAIDAGEPASVEILNGRADGEQWWNALDVAPVRDDEGDLTHFLGFQRDVTDRRRRAAIFEELHAVTERLQEAGTVDAVFEAAVEATRDVLELPLTACWRRRGDDSLVPVAATEAGWEVGPRTMSPGGPAYEAFERGEPVALDVSRPEDVPISTGLYFPLDRHGLLGAAAPDVDSYPDYLFDAGQVLADHVTAALDRVERQRALRERERELRRYETIVAAAGDPIYTLDAEGRFTRVNDAMASFVGYDADALVGTPISRLMNSEDVDRCERAIRALLTEPDDQCSVEVTMETVDGEQRQCEIAIALLPSGGNADPGGTGETEPNADATSDDGPFAGTVGVVRDITERERERQRLAVLDRVLRHNLRNKLNVIQGRAHTLAEGDGESEREVADGASGATAIADAADGLLSLTEKVRAFDRTRRSPTRRRDAVAIVEQVADEVRRELRTPIDVETTWAAPTIADDGLDLAVREVVENAAKHGGGAPVTVEVRRARAAGVEWIEVAVEDHGSGLPEAEQAALDGEVETPLSHASGIGLWLVAWAVNGVGGTVDYDTGDDGTVVRLRFQPAE
jgi:PAS domain S-box-containing protein